MEDPRVDGGVGVEVQEEEPRVDGGVGEEVQEEIPYCWRCGKEYKSWQSVNIHMRKCSMNI